MILSIPPPYTVSYTNPHTFLSYQQHHRSVQNNQCPFLQSHAARSYNRDVILLLHAISSDTSNQLPCISCLCISFLHDNKPVCGFMQIYTQACPCTSLFSFCSTSFRCVWVKCRAQPEAISHASTPCCAYQSLQN